MENALFRPDPELEEDGGLLAPEIYESWKRIKIRQNPKLADDGDTILEKAGVFCEVTKEGVEPALKDTTQLDCLFLLYRNERTHFAAGGKPDCRSINGEYPVQLVFSSTCNTCRYNPSVTSNLKERQKCKLLGSLLLLVRNPDEKDPAKCLSPYIFQVTPGGRQSVGLWLQNVMNEYVTKKDGLYLSQFAVMTRIGIEKTVGPEGKDYYIPTFPDRKFYEDQSEKLMSGKGINEAMLKSAWEHYTKLKPRFLPPVSEPKGRAQITGPKASTPSLPGGKDSVTGEVPFAATFESNSGIFDEE